MTKDSPLMMLRDIHQPAEVSFWPLAPGWWGMISLFMIVILLAWWMLWPKLQRRWRVQYWQKKLSQLAKAAKQPKRCHKALMHTSVLLHQLAYQNYPDRTEDQFKPDEWFQFLNQTSDPQQPFTNEFKLALTQGPYNPKFHLSESQSQQLYSTIFAWVKKHV